MLGARRSLSGPRHDRPQTGGTTRPLGWLYLVAAALGPITLATPHYPVIDEAGVLGVSALAVVLGAGLLALGSRLPSRLIPVAVAAGSALTAAAIEFTGGVPNAASLLFLWIALYAFYFFSRVHALVQMAFVGVCYAAAIALTPPPFPVVAHWITTMTTLTTAGLLVGMLKERLTERSRELDINARDTRRILDTAQDAFISIDGAGTVVDWNDAAERIFGWSREEVLGREMAELILPPDLRAAHREGLRRIGASADSEMFTRTIEVPARRRDGSELPVEIAMSASRRGGVRVFNAFIRDVTARQRMERYVRAQLEVTQVLADSPSWDAAEPRLLTALGSVLDWEIGAVWAWDDEARALRCRRFWTAEEVSAPAFERATRNTLLRDREGPLAGRAWREATPIWLDEPVSEPRFLRRAPAAQDGIRAAIAIPVLDGDRVLAVLELFTRRARPADPELLHVLCNLGSQMAQFHTRKQAERDLLDEAELRTAVAGVTEQLSRLTDPVAARTTLCEGTVQVLGCEAAWLLEPDDQGGLAVTAGSGCTPEIDGGLRDGASRALTDLAQVRLAGSGDTGPVSLEPLVSSDRTFGVLAVSAPDSASASSRRFRLGLQVIAREAVVGLERVSLLEQLELAARTDALTGLANRRVLDEVLERELKRAKRSSIPLSVAIIDIDHFKRYNDQHGHQAGDRLLREAATAWRAQLRDSDTLARYGGEEFVAVLPACSNEDCVALIERLRHCTPTGVTCSAGIATSTDCESGDSLLSRADIALYRAKHAGRDRSMTWLTCERDDAARRLLPA